MKRKILLIGRDSEFTLSFIRNLQKEYQVTSAVSGIEGIQAASSPVPDLLILDSFVQSEGDGFTICDILRNDAKTRNIPVIMMGERNDVALKIKAFQCGADDFVVKPVEELELLARIDSKMRRIRENKSESEVFECGNLKLDVERLEVIVAGTQVQLSVLEFNLLRFFIRNVNRVLSREQILKHVWREQVSKRTVDAHIVALRRKLGGFNHEVVTIYGAGYVLRKCVSKGVAKGPVEGADEHSEFGALKEAVALSAI